MKASPRYANTQTRPKFSRRGKIWRYNSTSKSLPKLGTRPTKSKEILNPFTNFIFWIKMKATNKYNRKIMGEEEDFGI